MSRLLADSAVLKLGVVGYDIHSEVVANTSGMTHFMTVATNNQFSLDAADERVAGSSTDGAVVSDRCRLGSMEDSYMGMGGIGVGCTKTGN